MIYNFDTENQNEAIAALLVYVVYRSRDKTKFKVTPEMWGQIERFIKAAAKRAKTLPRFVDDFKPKLSCATLIPKWMDVGTQGRTFLQHGDSFVEFSQADKRNFLTEILAQADDKAVLACLRHETSLIVLLVRDRLEKEKPIEHSFFADEDDV